MERAVLVYTTWPSVVEAEKAGCAILERRLAACVGPDYQTWIMQETGG